MDWNALKIFLTIAESGSLTAAARKLKISQPTLSRKLTNLEESLDSQLFQRLPRGLVLTEAGESIMHSVQQMGDQVLDVEKKLTGQNLRLEGNVLLTTTEYIGNFWIPEQMRGFRKLYPGISVKLQVDMQVVNLVRREADIAVRLGRPEQPDLIAKKLGSFFSYLAASKSYLEKYGTPKGPEDLKDHYAVGYNQDTVQNTATQRLYSYFHRENILFSSNSLNTTYEAINKGLGIGMMPDLAVERYPDVQYLFMDKHHMELEVWLVTHADIQHNARIRALFDYLADSLSRRLKKDNNPVRPTTIA
ncbi:MAG: LysR family transcriptional regulator [Alphaproteobacteria bacterium]|nr:LysR family transcriptional regulator [Alphaproteobacteria bacterium]